MEETQCGVKLVLGSWEQERYIMSVDMISDAM